MKYRRNAAVLASILCVPLHALAQSPKYPVKPIRMVVGYAPGGGSDIMGRLIAQQIAETLGQQVVVENRAGAAQNIAAELVAKSPADGYTLFLSSAALGINVSLYPKLNYDPARFVPITVLAAVPNVLMVHPSLPVHTVQEFIAYARANPDKLSYASQGRGSTAHLTAELFKMKTGTSMVHVPYKGDAPAIADLLAGHVQLMFGNIAAATTHARAGKLRILAVTGPKRLASLPDTPPMNEVVPGVIGVAWFAMVAPPGTPLPIAARISSTVADILRTPDIQRRFAEVGAEPIGNTPEEMAVWMKEDTERWRAVIKAGNIKVD